MSGISTLMDNDVVIKLAQMDCYGDALNAMDLDVGDVASLGFMLRYMGRTSEAHRLRIMKTSQAADRLAGILNGIAEIEPTPQESMDAAKILKQALLAGLDLDEGEVGLMAIALSRGSLNIVTGDKKALRSMPGMAQVNSALLKLKQHLICFEQVLSRLCQRFGYPRICAAVKTAPEADTVARMAVDQYGDKGGQVFLQLMQHLVREQIEVHSPGWLKQI